MVLKPTWMQESNKAHIPQQLVLPEIPVATGDSNVNTVEVEIVKINSLLFSIGLLQVIMHSLLPSQSSIRIKVSSKDHEILSACNEMSFRKRVVSKEHFLAHSVHSRHQNLDRKLHVGPCGPETQWLAFLEDIPRCEVMALNHKTEVRLALSSSFYVTLSCRISLSLKRWKSWLPPLALL